MYHDLTKYQWLALMMKVEHCCMRYACICETGLSVGHYILA